MPIGQRPKKSKWEFQRSRSQMLLNRHPEISCPSEHLLFLVFEGVSKLFTDYNKEIYLIN